MQAPTKIPDQYQPGTCLIYSSYTQGMSEAEAHYTFKYMHVQHAKG